MTIPRILPAAERYSADAADMLEELARRARAGEVRQVAAFVVANGRAETHMSPVQDLAQTIGFLRMAEHQMLMRAGGWVE